MKRWFAGILAGCMLLQITLGSPIGFMKAEDTVDSLTNEQTEQPTAAPADEEQPVEAAFGEQTEASVQAKQEQPEAAAEEQEHVDEQPAQEQEETSPEPKQAVKAAVRETEKKQVNGSITAMILSGQSISEKQSYTLKLKGMAYEQTKTVAMEATEGASQTSAVFENLPEGAYTLQITAKGYRTYEQSFQVTGYDLRIAVYLGSAPKLDGDILPGILAYDVSTVQLKELIDALDRESKDTAFDINHDGKVDLVDLQQLYDERKPYTQQTSAIETRIAKGAVTVETESGTKIAAGSVEDVLDGASTVSLQREDEKAISAENPVQLHFDFTQNVKPVLMEGFTVQAPADSTNKIANGEVLVELEDGTALRLPIVNYYRSRRSASSPFVELDAKGNMIVHLGEQVAVKKITIKITQTTQQQGSLVEISKVEFLNDMEQRIPEPEMNIPKGLQGTPGDKKFTVSWDPERNVTGYEVKVEADGITEIHKTTQTTLTLTQFHKDKLENKKAYTVRVQSVNGAWSSGYSDAIVMIPVPSSKPAAPDDVKAAGAYRSITLSWKAMKDTDSYNVFYKIADSDADYTKLSGISTNKYTLQDLKDNTAYSLYVSGVNELGEGPASLKVKAATLSVKRAKMPSYKLINDSNGEGKLTQHIVSAKRAVGNMVNSPLDDAASLSANGLVDDSYESYYQLQDWDDAVSYHPWQWGTTVQLDQEYTMDRFTLAAPLDSATYSNAAIYYWDSAQNKEVQANGVSIQQKDDGQGRKYYTIKLRKPITTNRVRFGIQTYGSYRNIMIAEIRFFQYDSLESDIQALFQDDLHLALAADVNAERLDALQKRLDTKDHDEYHPDQAALQKELDAAKALFADQDSLKDIVSIHADLRSGKDSQISVGGLNAWQPLGISGYAGQQLIIYVGNPKMKSGQTSALKLIATQQHAEASGFAKEVATLKVGRNEITIPRISSTDVEKGGSLYIQYTGGSDSDQYAVRADVESVVPKLDLYHVTDISQRKQRIRKYVEELQAFVPKLEETHDALHVQQGNEHVSYAYDEKNCTLNVTDIMLDQMMYSIPASQVWSVISAGSVEEGAKKLDAALQAMDEMMTLFYQHKGLTNSFAADTPQSIKNKNHLPAQHLNIRYMRMFSGAFMYASGNHIGIEWDETEGLIKGRPVEKDANGKKISGQYFGWGVAHEIGHNINQGSYAIAEITNNYFSILAQADDTNNGVRFKYEDVYKKVTSNTVGRSESVFTQLGMYWQLHLAYDRGYNYKTYADYDEIFDNLFFARVDSYARDTASAPAPNGVALKLGENAEQNIMRLSSAAAQRDLSDFFVRWGMVIDEDTREYMQQFEKETRAIYYVNDEARAYEIEHGTAGAITNQNVAIATVKSNNRSSVTLSLSHDKTAVNSDAILGYEIVRCTIEQGKAKEETVGFTTASEFTDNVAAISNRTVSYKVTAIDKFMNRSAVARVTPVKVEGDGSQQKDAWTITTNMLSKDDVKQEAQDEDPCAPAQIPAAYRMIDDSTAEEHIYIGTAATADPQITIHMGKTTELTALRYHSASIKDSMPISKYKIEISQDGKAYTKIKEGEFSFNEQGIATIYFQNEQKDPWVVTYDAAYIRITAVGQKDQTLNIGEFDILGPTGDNIEFYQTQEQVSIGILKTDFVLQEQDETHERQVIEKGSLVFTGTYKGNPAYNAVLLYDENGNVVGGTDAEGAVLAQQAIFAPKPGDALLGEVSDGTWVYWISPENRKQDQLPKNVRAELYRVDNALTNEGQRLVSDTLFVEVAETLPDITLSK